MLLKIYKKIHGRLSESQLESKIKEIKDLKRIYEDEILSLASSTPCVMKDLEGVEMAPHEYIPMKVREIMEELDSVTIELWLYESILDNVKYNPEDIEWEE